MCKFRSCWGTVEELKIIIDEGYAQNLMIDYYQSEDFNDGNIIYFLCGATQGNEGSKADFNPVGQCSFLVENKCTIHDIKPLEGAVSCCENPHDVGELRHHVLQSWISSEGKELIKTWKRMVDYKHKEDLEGANPISAMKLILDFLEQSKP